MRIVRKTGGRAKKSIVSIVLLKCFSEEFAAFHVGALNSFQKTKQFQSWLQWVVHAAS